MIFSNTQLIKLILDYRYLIILPIAIIEGPIITVICGFLVSAGQLNLYIVYLIVMLGDLIGDIGWYYLGYCYGHRFVKRFGKRFGITEEKISKAKEKFHNHKDSILFMSKLTNGLGLAVVVLFTAGLSKIPFRRYMVVNVVGEIIWSAMLLALGYFFGNIFLHSKSIQGKFLISIGAIILVFLGIKYLKVIRAKIAP